MNGVESTNIAGFTNPVFVVTGPSKRQSAMDREDHQARRSAGMEGALKLSGDFVRQAMSEVGFVNIQADGTEKIEAFIRSQGPQENGAQTGLEPAMATEIAAHAGAQIAGEIDQALRVLARLDPARAAALLK